MRLEDRVSVSDYGFNLDLQLSCDGVNLSLLLSSGSGCAKSFTLQTSSVWGKRTPSGSLRGLERGIGVYTAAALQKHQFVRSRSARRPDELHLGVH